MKIYWLFVLLAVYACSSGETPSDASAYTPVLKDSLRTAVVDSIETKAVSKEVESTALDQQAVDREVEYESPALAKGEIYEKLHEVDSSMIRELDSLKQVPINLLVPLYNFVDTHEWSQVGTLFNEWNITGGMIVPNSDHPEAAHLAIDAFLKAAGGKRPQLYGYVHLLYGKRPIDEVYADISRYYELFDHFTGIFFDEVPREPMGNLDSDSTLLAYFGSLKKHITQEASDLAVRMKKKDASVVVSVEAMDQVILNPGTGTVTNYMDVCDILINAEKFSASSSCPGSYSAEHWKWLQPAWVQEYKADRFMHIVHSIGDEKDLLLNMELARSRNVDWLFFSDRSRSCNIDRGVYNKMPSKEFFESFVKALAR